jgi:type I restriction enzyme S subunit
MVINMEKTLKPALRFKGFTDTWEQCEVGKIFKVTRGYVLPVSATSPQKTENTPYPVYSSQTQNNGLMGYFKDYLFDTAITWTTDGANAGTVNFRGEKFYSTNVNGVLLSDKGYANKCIAEALNRIAWKFVSHVGNPKLMNNVMSEIELVIPSTVAEQVSISNLFTKVDDLITLHQRKHEKLINVKKALLDKMFPKNGELVPQLRFKGFTDTWEQRELRELGSVAMNKRIFKDQTTVSGDVPFYKIGTFGSSPDAYITRNLFEEYKSKYPYPEIGDILISASGSIGRTVEYKGKDEYFQDSNIVWLKHNDEVENIFLKHFYSVVKWSGLEGSTIQRLYNKNILDTHIKLPDIEEQKRLGGFLDNLDKVITLHQRKYEKLVNIKKSLLQKMFV